MTRPNFSPWPASIGRSDSRGLRRVLRVAAVVAVSIVCSSLGVATAADLTVTVGFGGATRMGAWAPVRISVANGAGTKFLRIESPDPDDQTPFRVLPVLLDGSGNGRVDTAFRAGRSDGVLTVRLLADEGREIAVKSLRMSTESGADLPTPLRHDIAVWATLGEVPGFDPAKDVAAKRRVLRIDDSASLPRDPRGYATLDALVIATGKSAGDGVTTGGPGWENISAEQSSAILSWVRSGGHLVVTVGTNADRVALSPLGRALPFTFKGGSSTRQLGRLETLCSANTPIPLAGGIPRAVCERTDDSGTTLAEDGAGPLMMRVPLGFGLLTVLAVDLDVGPLSNWKNVGEFAPLLVQSSAQRILASSEAESPLRHQGISDIASQWSAKLDSHAAVKRPSYWTVLALLLGLLTLVGPLDYWLVNRLLKQPTLTWITLPLWLAGGILVGGWWSDRANGSTARGQLLEILDIDESGHLLRGTAWLNVFSPRTARDSIQIKPTEVAGSDSPSSAPLAEGTTAGTRWFGWMAEPEGSPGGLYRGSMLSAAKGAYRVDDGELRADAVPILKWSTKQMLARWESDAGGDWVDNKLVSPGPGRLSGSLAIRRQLPLVDVVLVHGGRIYLPRGDGALRPFLPWEPNGADSRQRDLRSYLTGTTGKRVQISVNQSEVQFKPEPYDPLNFDSVWLMRMSTFLQAAGGRVYSGLDNRYLRELDMTDLMHAGRAILIGRLDKPVCRVELGGKELDVGVPPRDENSPAGAEAADKQASFVRIVLPVKRTREEDRLRKKEFKDEVDRIQREGRG